MSDARLLPPGRTEAVHAESVLVVAPHYDDEVLGCGGLAAQLAAAGAAVRVLFLSDGGGGAEEVGDREAYRRRRREEAARAGEVLGLSGSDHLGLPDGGLEHAVEEICFGLRRALLSQRPELLLAPSPLEATRDHRAAFAALHRLLGSLREAPGGGSGHAGEPPRGAGSAGATELLAGLRILLYEVNHPGYPDLLVDVSAEAGVLERAMACYASQEERHGYLRAALGLRRFRTLSLPPEVELAEGYRRLASADFATRSPAQLVRHLGGAAEVLAVDEGPRISVVVRTRDRPALLAEALASLAAGSYRRAEVVLVNDGGAPPEVPAGYPLPVVRVDLQPGRGRAGAAEAGVAAATGEYVAFLDDDDLAAPEHLATLAGLVSAAGVRVAYTDAAVAVYELDAGDAGDGGDAGAGWVCRERRLPYSRDFDPDLLLVDNYIPFNTLLVERGLFAAAGPFDPALPFFEDWDFLIRLAALTPFHHLARVTCEYRHFRGGAHHVFGERPRERADFLAVKARVLGKHAARLPPEILARAVDRLRSELVEEREARGAARRELAARQEELSRRGRELAGLSRAHEALAGERFAWEERFHQANGEAAALRGDNARLAAEVGHLHGDRSRLGEREAALQAEIERLNRLVRDMESTRAWRAHQWWQRRRR